MNTSPLPQELPGLRVTLDRLVYRHAPEASPDRPHCFVYFISIHNQSDQTLTIKGRKWVVAHDDGTTTVVEGDGVVGQTPCLDPGEKFSYNSQHCIETPRATAEGSYLGVTASGQRVVVRIPCFEMIVPPEQ
ncbi:MAG TPA: ApaG domain [Verrucomicrobiales bacterium]|nr:ApaG domain [Verrucomicrobiales bacterium]